jgi:hypothetical protein
MPPSPGFVFPRNYLALSPRNEGRRRTLSLPSLFTYLIYMATRREARTRDSTKTTRPTVYQKTRIILKSNEPGLRWPSEPWRRIRRASASTAESTVDMAKQRFWNSKETRDRRTRRDGETSRCIRSPFPHKVTWREVTVDSFDEHRRSQRFSLDTGMRFGISFR